MEDFPVPCLSFFTGVCDMKKPPWAGIFLWIVIKMKEAFVYLLPTVFQVSLKTQSHERTIANDI